MYTIESRDIEVENVKPGESFLPEVWLTPKV